MGSRLVAGRYEVGTLLGEGGMAVVYAGTDLHLGRRVAVKLLREQYAADPACVERFQLEARAAAGLSHPSIVAVYDLGPDGNTHFIAMELVEGESLKAILQREAPLDPGRILHLGLQIADALACAHRHGLVHRDVKPQNVLVTREDHARVSDFGIATALGRPTLTPSGIVLGTAQYLSPEQARGEACTPASDVYSAGVVLYEMATGRLPFEADNPAAVARMHVEAQPPAMDSLNPRVPRGLREIVERTLAKDPADRYPSGAELAAALREYQARLRQPTGEQAAVGPPPRPTRLGRRPTRFPETASVWGFLGPVAAVVIALALLAAAATSAVESANASRRTEAGLAALGATATAVADLGTASARSAAATGTAMAGLAPTATAQALAVATAGARVDATARALQGTAAALAAAAPTATVRAEVEATARAAQATVQEASAGAQRLYTPEDGRLNHRPDGMAWTVLVEGMFFPQAVRLRNLGATARFYNPYDPSEGAWDYGFVFRGGGSGDGYRLYVDSGGRWHLELATVAGGKLNVDPLASGQVRGLRPQRNNYNLLNLTVKGGSAVLYVNGEHAATVDVVLRDLPGELWIATGFARGHTLGGRATRYQDLRVLALP